MVLCAAKYRLQLAGRGVCPRRERDVYAAAIAGFAKQVAQGRRLVSVTVTTDAEDEEARSLMVDIGADEISSAADGTMHVVHRAPPPGAVPPNA